VKIKIACAQMEIIPGQPDVNTEKALQAIAEAKAAQVDLLLLPEMTVPGYLLGDVWEQNAFLNDCQAYGQELIAASQNICLVFGNIALDKDHYNEDGHKRKYNAAFVAQNGKLIKGATGLPFIPKTNLPNYREFDDTRYFHDLKKLAPELKTGYSVDDCLQPVLINFHGEAVPIGIMLCEDGWTDNYYYKVPNILADHGSKLLCNISCSPYTLGKNSKRHSMFGAQAKACGVPLLYCNNIGVQNNGKNIFTYDGGSSIYNAEGTLIASAKEFAPQLLISTFDTTTGDITSEAGLAHEATGNEAVYQALRFGAKNFLAQAGLKKITIGVSGGIDSAVTAALYVDILGPENVLLVNMPSIYNSALTKNLAQEMAAALGANYTIVPIQQAVDMTVEQCSTSPIHNYSKNQDFNLTVTPFAKENIQARDRGSRVLAALSASFGGVFSCNANKAEVTVGYGTFYGDLAGCLAVLGDLWKHQVYALGRYLNDKVYKKSVIPEQIFTIAPSAELSAAQTVGNGGDPIIYPYHDYLFRSFIEKWEKSSPENILSWYLADTLEEHIGCEKGLAKKLFPTPQAFIADLERWWKLFAGFAVAKRIQAPPILAISPRAYGFDYREAQLKPYYSRKYLAMKAELLK
jgi:NAD+ synthase (glutamine-hydrolysing)